MNETWQLISTVSGTSQLLTDRLIAQVAAPTAPTISTDGVENFVKQTTTTVGSFLPNLLGAIITLFVGWIVASIVSTVVRNLLKRTDLDNRLGNWVTGGTRSAMNTEKIGGDIA
ncbi:MAG: hypothetical protein RLZZ135_1527, partial [Cyanobacteriota bacterium]